MLRLSSIASLCLASFSLLVSITGAEENECQKTEVLILGAGAAGIQAAKTLHERNVTDFIILEYNDEIGGRVRHHNFGKKPNSNGSYTIELGAMWIEGIGNENNASEENPLWTAAKKYGLRTTSVDQENTLYYDESGPTDLSSLNDEFADALDRMYELGDRLAEDDGPDMSIRTGLRLVGWNSENNLTMQAVEVVTFDADVAVEPGSQSLVYAAIGQDEGTGPDFGGAQRLVVDERGFNYLLHREMESFMRPYDTRLHLSMVVTNISVADDFVRAHTEDGGCFEAKYAICTFSVGVLKNAALEAGLAPISFDPPLPEWKQQAIAGFGMTIFTKMFMQFDPSKPFWPVEADYFMFASSSKRGYYNTWIPLARDDMLTDSGIISVAVFQDMARIVEAQSDADTKDQIMNVLRDMFGDNVTEPLNFYYPRWGREPWAFGSYSYWPVGYTVEQYRNLTANVGRLWFAGEAMEAQYESEYHGAWINGQKVGARVVECLSGEEKACEWPGNETIS